MPKVESYLPLLNLIYGQWKVCEHKMCLVIYCLSTAKLLYGRNGDVLQVLNNVCVFTLTTIACSSVQSCGSIIQGG